MTGFLKIVALLAVVFYAAGATASLAYLVASGRPLRRCLGSWQWHLQFLLVGFIQFLTFFLIWLSHSPHVSLIAGILNYLPYSAVAAVYTAAAFTLGLLLALAANRIFPRQTSGAFRAAVGLLATLPVLALGREILRVLGT